MAWHLVRENGTCSSNCWCHYLNPQGASVQLAARPYAWKWRPDGKEEAK